MDHFICYLHVTDIYQAQFAIIPPEGMPTTNLSVRRSLLLANMYISLVDTPQRWLALPTPVLPPMNDLGLTWAQQQTVDKARRVAAAAAAAVLVAAPLSSGGRGTSGSWENERDRDGKDKRREGIYNQVRNPNMHTVLETMMKPVLDAQISFRVNILCKLAGIQDMHSLSQCNNNRFR